MADTGKIVIQRTQVAGLPEVTRIGRAGAAATLAAAFGIAAGVCTAQSSVIGSSGQSGTASGTSAGSHQTGPAIPGTAASSSPLGTSGPWDASSPFPDTTRQKRNDDRQRRLVNDTQKLLALTSQLKAEVASSGAEAMTPEMLKQMEEIEKLAKSVKDKMRD